MTSNRKNEGKCCDAIMRVLATRERASYTVKDLPDSRPHGGVEVVCGLAGEEYALEHTVIEPYLERIADDQQFLNFLEPLREDLNAGGVLPKEGAYELVVDIHALRGIKKSQIHSVRSALRSWVVETVSKLARPDPGRMNYVRETPSGVPFSVSLQRVWWDGGTMKIARFAPQNQEALRRSRIRDSLAAKCPKLAVCKREGAISVLILESDDDALSNVVVIGKAVRAEMASVDTPPDEVYLVETNPSQQIWTVYALKLGPAYWPSEIWHDLQSNEFDPLRLDDLTVSSTPPRR